MSSEILSRLEGKFEPRDAWKHNINVVLQAIKSREGGYPTRDMAADHEEANSSSEPLPAKRQRRYNLILSCLNVIYVVNLEFGVLLSFMVD